MKEENYRNLLTFKDVTTPKNELKFTIVMDSNDADDITNIVTLDPEILFSNKKLIYCLAYVSCDYDFKGHSWSDNVFGHHITENTDINDLEDILWEYDLLCYSSEWGECHSFEEIEIIYYDENGVAHKIGFDKIRSRWRTMSYEEICEEINSISENESNS